MPARADLPAGGWLRAASVYLDRRVIAVLFLGFASGLPLLLTASTLSVRLATLGVDLTTIGLFALVGVPYSLKFLWAPLIDRMTLPYLGAWLGRRRAWAILTQLALMACLVSLGAVDPLAAPVATAALAFAVAFWSASQDIVIDAYRVEILEERQFGAGAAAVVLGYRMAILVAGAGALHLAEAVSWFHVYAVMAALVTVGIVTLLLAGEPAASAVVAPPGRPATGALAARLVAWLNDAMVGPFVDFMRRPGWLAILAFIMLYKFGDALAGVMANPFYVAIGFTKAEIANVSKIFGLAATLVGGLVGGIMVNRLGISRSLLIAGVLQMGSNLMFAVQAAAGHDIVMLMATIGIENLAGGMGTAAFVAYLSSLCNVAYTATQYALLSSLMSVARTTFAAPGGWLALQLDWIGFFLVTTVAALPGLLLLVWLRRRFPPRPALE